MKKRYDRPYHEPLPPKSARLYAAAMKKIRAPKRSEGIVHKWDDDWLTATTGPATGGWMTTTISSGTTFSGAIPATTSATSLASLYRKYLVTGTFTTSGTAYFDWPAVIPPAARRAMREAIIDCSVMSLSRRAGR